MDAIAGSVHSGRAVCTQQPCTASAEDCYWSEIDLFKSKMSERLRHSPLPLSASIRHICSNNTQNALWDNMGVLEILAVFSLVDLW